MSHQEGINLEKTMTLSKPITKNNPILTIRWLTTEMQGYIGPDVNLTLKVTPERAIKGTETTKEKCLYQKSIVGFIAGQTYVYTIEATVEEEDPVIPYGPVAFEQTFEVKAGILPKDALPANKAIEPIVHQATDDDGPWGVRTAVFSFNCHWYLTADIFDAISYISTEMDVNKNSQEATTLKTLNRFAKGNFTGTALDSLIPLFVPVKDFPVFMKGLAYAYWVILVGPRRKWDHKPSIFPAFGKYSLDALKGKMYFNDVWSNMHYGYIGRVIGFSEKELIYGAAVAQAVDDVTQKIGSARIKKLAESIVSLDLKEALEILVEIANDPALRQQIQEIYEKVKQGDIAGLDNNDDSGSILLGSERLYDKYGDGFIDSKETREFIIGIIRRRRKYDPNSKMKVDAIEGICAI